MNERREFHPLQAGEIPRAFNAEGVDYLFIGKSGAILPGVEFNSRHPTPLRSATDVTSDKARPTGQE